MPEATTASATENEELDALLNSADFHHDPYPIYKRLREEAPVFWSEIWQSWIVTRYDDVHAIFRDHRNFSNAGRQTSLIDRFSPEEQEQLQPIRKHYESGGLINSDQPTHTRLRKLIGKALTPAIVRSMESMVREIAEDTLRQVRDKGGMDLIADFAFPLPAIVIAGLLGIPSEDRHLFKEWSADTNPLLQTPRVSLEEALKSQESILALREYLQATLDARRSDPREDLLSKLATVREDDDQLSPEECLSTACTLLIAGHETTTNLIGNGMLALLQDADALAELRANPELLPVATEEFLRYDPSVQLVKRVALNDVEVAGATIRKGDLIQVSIGSANRDENHFPQPDKLDFHRDNYKHIAFGSGIHLCLGAALARLEGPVAFDLLLNRLPGIRLAVNPDQLEWSPGTTLRGLRSLPVAF